MAKYILVYHISDYPDCGGGMQYEEFGLNENDMHNRVGKLMSEEKDRFSIILAGFVNVEFNYEVIKYATKVNPIRIQ